MLTLLSIVIIVGLIVAVLIGMLESGGGYLGDSSMVPGCLGILFIIVLAILAAGYLNGHINISIH